MKSRINKLSQVGTANQATSKERVHIGRRKMRPLLIPLVSLPVWILLVLFSQGASAFVSRSNTRLCVPCLGSSSNSNDKSNNSNEYDLQKITIGNQDFWTQQKQLAEEMTETSAKSLKQEQKEKFEKRRLALVAETAYFSALFFAGFWMISDTPFTALSYLVGASLGLAYAYGLGKSVETLGASVDDVSELQGAGVGEARFAFLILLFVIVGKFRGDGLQEIPAISGFFTYQLASLRQGLREIND